RVVADTPVGKDVEVVIIRKGAEETKTVRLRRLGDGGKPAQASVKKDSAPPESKGVVKRTLGLDLANLTDDLRKKYKVKDSLKGPVVTAVEPGSRSEAHTSQ